MEMMDVGMVDYQTPEYLLGYGMFTGPNIQYICDQIGWGEFRLEYVLEDFPVFV